MSSGRTITLPVDTFREKSYGRERPSIIYIVYVNADGSATWTIEHRLPLETSEDEKYFEEYRASFESQGNYLLEQFSNRTTDLLQRASAVTGRDMVPSNFSITIEEMTTVTGKLGLIIYRFEWSGFARIEGENRIVGDVFEGGLYLYRDDAFSLKPPPGFQVTYVSPPADISRDSELVWYGLRNFGSGEPRIEISRLLTTATESYTATTGVSTTVTSTEEMGSDTATSRSLVEILMTTHIWLLLGLGAATGVLVPAALWRRRRRHVSLESDEDRVINMLKQAGGVMTQSEIKYRTGFSKTKTSVVLKALEKKGMIGKTRRGREYIVKFRRL